MSLRVWIPMVRDSNGQGVIKAPITTYGLTLNDNGKLGKCGSFNGSSNVIATLPTAETSSIGTMSCWVKFNSFPASGAWYCLMQLGTAGGFANCRLGLYMQYQTGIVVCINGSSNSNLYTHSLTTNQWYHLCTTFDGTTVRLYIDGVEVWNKTAVVGSYTTATSTLYVGGTNNYYFKGYMNDVRYYDHALSPKEVKELAKGLVCHYPLNNNGGGQPNLLKNSNFTEGSSGSQGYNFTATWAKQTDCMKITSGSASSGLYTSNFDSITTGTMTTFSAYVKADTDMTVYIGVDGSGIGNCQAYTVGNSWQRISISKAKTTDNANLRLYGKGIFYIKLLKYELGDKTTPWQPHSTDSTYSSLGYDSTTIYDCSGYQNNATPWAYDNTGSIDISSDTPRYSVSTFINSANVTNNATGIRYIYGNCELTTPQYLTVAFWCKPIAGYGSYACNGLFALTNNDIGTGAATDYNTAPMHNRDAYIDMCTSTNVHKTLSFSGTLDEWHHYAVVYDGRYGKAYIDGVQTATLDMNSNLSLASFKAIVLGYSHAGGVYRKLRAYYSDFRLYATALSAEQIAELYNTAVSVANNGALMGYELVEV